MRNVIIATALVGILASLEVNASVIAECGAFKGYTYFYPGPFIKKGNAGFTEDAISKGSFSIVTIEDKFDVIFTDASGSTKSSLSQGAKVIPISSVPDEVRWSQKIGQLFKVYSALYGGMQDDDTTTVYRGLQSQSRA